MAPMKLLRAYDNKQYLHSNEGRIIRVMAEFSEPKHRFEKNSIQDTVVFFGSARTLPLQEAKARLRELKKKKNVTKSALERAQMDICMAGYYEDAFVLSKKISLWAKKKTKSLAICSGGGPGIMEAANKGAKQAGFPSIGLNINLPFEQQCNPYIDKELNFEFHYFFLRKFWFLYHAKSLIVFPGGFGTLDEMMEALTLIQTKKIQKNMQVILYGEDYWRSVINFDFLCSAGVISKNDFKVFNFCSEVDSAFKLVTGHLGRLLTKRKSSGRSKSTQASVFRF